MALAAIGIAIYVVFVSKNIGRYDGILNVLLFRQKV